MQNIINELGNLRKSLNELSVYNLDVHSSLELYYEVARKVNEIINELNRFEGVVSDSLLEQNNQLYYLLNNGLKVEVANKLLEFLENGTLNEIINKEIFNDLSSKVEKLITNNDVNVIYVDSVKGLDTNIGTIDSPFQTSKKAFDYLCSLGSKTLFKQWKIKFNKGTYTSVKVDKLPQFTYPLIIEGTLEGTEIVSKFVYNDDDNYIGMWFEPLKGNSIHIKWLKFEGYKKGFNGYGVIAKNQGYLYIFECEAIDCDTGFAGVNNVTLTCQRTVVRRCTNGFRNLYNGCATIGSGTGGTHMSEGGNGCEVYDCEIGFLLSRNSVAHSDYVKFYNCNTAIQIEMNSRLATLSNHFNSCGVGVNCVGGSEWIGGIGEEIDTWTNITNCAYDLHGNSRYSRVQSLYGKLTSTFFRKIGSQITNSNITNNTSQVEIFRASPTIESIPYYYLERDNVTVELVIKGTFRQASGQTIKLTPVLRGLNDDNSTNGKNIPMGEISIPTESANLSGFKATFKLEMNKLEYLRYTELMLSNTTGGNRIATTPYLVSSSENREGKKQLLLNATLSNIASELNIQSIELILSN